jgi:hypothetical protein
MNLHTGKHCGRTRVMGWQNYVNRGGEGVKENCVVLMGEYSRYSKDFTIWPTPEKSPCMD